MPTNLYKKIARLLIRAGKYPVAARQLNNCLVFIKLFFKLNPSFVFKKALLICTPCFELKKIQKGNQAVYVVKFSKLSRRQSIAMRWLVSFSKSGSKGYKQLGVDLFSASNSKGKSFEKKIDLIRKSEIFKNNLIFNYASTTVDKKLKKRKTA
jgi:small subunit ribosomal protein S7